jgi:hypothetical protein
VSRAGGRPAPTNSSGVVITPGGHFDAYTGPGFEVSSAAARDWFVEHLLTAAAVAAEETTAQA